jgi:energy-coupling factor transport system ATP-binding protein
VIRCESVTFTYPDGTPALDGIDLSIGQGERVAIIGPNGAGKSTLVRLWNGLLRPTSGRVLVDGRSTEGRHVAELARIVALTFQDSTRQLFKRTCREEVSFGARNAGLAGRQHHDLVDSALAEVGLHGRGRTHPYDLGPSKRRLLTIACALAMRPKVIALDEPTKGLDSAEAELVEKIVREWPGVERSIVAISHDARFVTKSFARVIRLDAGRIVADGTPAEVLG